MRQQAFLKNKSKRYKNGHDACPSGERCLLKWGTLLAPSGHVSCQKQKQKYSWNLTLVMDLQNSLSVTVFQWNLIGI